MERGAGWTQRQRGGVTLCCDSPASQHPHLAAHADVACLATVAAAVLQVKIGEDGWPIHEESFAVTAGQQVGARGPEGVGVGWPGTCVCSPHVGRLGGESGGQVDTRWSWSLGGRSGMKLEPTLCQ